MTDARRTLEHMRELQASQMAALQAGDDLLLDDLIEQMTAALATIPDKSLLASEDPELMHLVQSIWAAQDELIATVVQQKAEVTDGLRALDQGRGALSAYQTPADRIGVTDHSA